MVQAAGFKTVNMLASPVKNAMQVQLQIRVAEVSKNKLRDLGSSFAYQGSPGAGGFISGGGPASPSDIVGGLLSGTFASATNLFLLGGNACSLIRAMQTNGALRALAEPNLIAMDGQVASFLAGGEFPIPVVQSGGGGGGNAVTIQFKEYGVRLNFKPTIIDEDHITSRARTGSFDDRLRKRRQVPGFCSSRPAHQTSTHGCRAARWSELCSRRPAR